MPTRLRISRVCRPPPPSPSGPEGRPTDNVATAQALQPVTTGPGVGQTRHGGCETEPYTPNKWIVENPFIFHADLARAFSNGHRLLHEFVERHPTHADDMAFGSFVNWATKAPARCLPFELGESQRRVDRRELASSRSTNITEAQPTSGALSVSGRRLRRLGLAGSPGWPFIRTHAAMWILYVHC